MTNHMEELVALAARAEAPRHPGLVLGAVNRRTGQRTAVGAGHTRLPDGPAPTADTLFEIGSITKVFTGLLLAIAVLRGELSLDAPVRELLPTDATVPDRDGVPISVLHLITHRSGLPRSPLGRVAEARAVLIDRANPYRDLTSDRVLDVVAHTQLRRTPGTGRIAYSNLGVGLLGLALVNAAGADSYAELVRSRICIPLGMTDTDVLEDIDPGRLAVGYQRGRPIDHWSLTGLAGAGALLSSGNDMLKFLAAQLQPDSTPLAEAVTLSHQERHHTRGFGIGLGWIVTGSTHNPILWHNGGTGGFAAFAGFDPRRGTGTVVLANSRRGPEPAGLRLLKQLDRRLLTPESHGYPPRAKP
jgi:CubicO group peptidase (beta-lactamase class C family)